MRERSDILVGSPAPVKYTKKPPDVFNKVE